MSNKLSVSNCPDCDSKSIYKIKWTQYNEQIYECKECKLLWSKEIRYCRRCRDVATYCKCYEELYE